MSIEVIDNFLPLSEFNELKSRILGKYFPWHYSDGIYKSRRKGGGNYSILFIGKKQRVSIFLLYTLYW